MASSSIKSQKLKEYLNKNILNNELIKKIKYIN